MLFSYFDSPKEKQLRRELDQMTIQYEFLNQRLNEMTGIMDEMQKRDDNIYRVIFEAEPIPSSIRQAGFGGVNRYKDQEGLSNSELVIETTKKMDMLAKQMVIQSKSFDEVVALVKDKEQMLASIPAIQPVSNEDLNRMASGFGYRIDPVYKTPKFHAGMDFSAPTGTPIYSTGDGRVVRSGVETGYGKAVRIDHGYGYMTLYAHMSNITARPGQKVKRGDIIGYVGNTGKSVGPHLHYEVHKDGQPINPINFYYGSISAEDFKAISELANQENQSLD
jgi:murein DD-endopeptidase MepM/ murein hydrolase activator NlpD